MVRVISVHHFTNQSIQTIEQPTACTTAHGNRLLLALTSHVVEVRNLEDDGEVHFTFPTVDEVTQMIYSMQGNYVATMETKFNRQNREINFVRVYVNWDSIATLQQSKMTSSGASLEFSECGMVQPMRARIAGRVTPTTNQSELGNLEMIEIPVKKNPSLIACCQMSGNLIIACNDIIYLHYFVVKSHDISKLRFVDFEEASVYFELSFVPTQIAFSENYFACLSPACVHFFKICTSSTSTSDGLMESSRIDLKAFSGNPDPIDLNEILMSKRDDFSVHLPSVVRENSILHKYSPYTSIDREITVQIRHSTHTIEHENMYAHDLLQLKMGPIMYENVNGDVAEAFKCLLIKPLYIGASPNNKDEVKTKGNIRSRNSKLLRSVALLFATQQEGFLYNFQDCMDTLEVDNCLAVYPFTAPVHELVMEDYFLHALTDTGLETYTLRIAHKLYRILENVDDVNVACPPVDTSICLAGLRPFLGVEKMLLSEENLILLANSDYSPTHSVSSNGSSTTAIWTLYNLELPTPKTIFNDISIVANVHRFTSAQTYCHLMSEAHMILRAAVMYCKWDLLDRIENVVLVALVNSGDECLHEAYRTSCALLGDHFVLCSNEEDYKLATPYYKMAKISPSEVLKRVQKVQAQANSWVTSGLLHYLKTILLLMEGNTDRIFRSNSKQQDFIESVFELFEKHDFEDFTKLVLKCGVLREHSVERLLNILNKKITNDNTEKSEKCLALTVLHLQKCDPEVASECLTQMDDVSLKNILLAYWELLFEEGYLVKAKKRSELGFSELMPLLIGVKSDILADVLVALTIENKVINVHKLIRAFMEYLPISIGTDSSNSVTKIMQKWLEAYFLNYFEKHKDRTDMSKIVWDRGVSDAMRILVRVYLSRLQVLELKERKIKKSEKNTRRKVTNQDEPSEVRHIYFEELPRPLIKNEEYLFSNRRFSYLDKLPPFEPSVASKECNLPDEEADLVLKKLQALLSAAVVPENAIEEIENIVKINVRLRGNISLKSLLLSVGEAVPFLLEVCPECIVQFGKDRFTKPDEWKLLIASIQRRILNLHDDASNEGVRLCSLYKQLLEDALTYVATTMKLEQLVQVFPQRLAEDGGAGDAEIIANIQNYDTYVGICKETMHANQIRKLISATGQQLLCTLNL